MRGMLNARGVMVLTALVTLVGATTTNAKSAVPSSQPESRAHVKARVSPAHATKPCTLPGIPAQRLDQVVDASNTLQPPLAADAMIRIATKIAAPCPDLARDLFQSAFDQAESVEPETAFKLAPKSWLADSRISYAAHGYSQQMDRLSLQSRAVLGMVPLDAKKAIQLFQRMTPPRLSASTCANVFVPDVSIYYEALEKIVALMKAQRSPNPNEDQQAPFRALQEATGATTSPLQLTPLAKLLEEVNLTVPELSALTTSLATAIEGFQSDDNSFYSGGTYPAVKAKGRLLLFLGKQQIPTAGLTHAFRDYFDRSLSAPHCDNNEPKDLKALVTLYESFNRSPATSDQGIEALSIPTSLPPIEPGPNIGEYWLGPRTAELLVDAKHLNFDDNWRPFTNADRQTPEWQDRVHHLLNDMDNWNASDESNAADYYHQRCILLYRTLASLPPGALYDRVVAAWTTTFAESTLHWDHPAEWYFEVSMFLESSKRDSKGPMPPSALRALKNSSNRSLQAIGVLREFLQ